MAIVQLSDSDIIIYNSEGLPVTCLVAKNEKYIMYTIVSYIHRKSRGLQIIIVIRGRRLGAMGTRTKVMKTTKNVTIKIV